MSTLKTTLALLVAGMMMAGTSGSAQAAPLPTNVAAMKSMIGTDTVQVRWGGWGGGWRGGGFGYRGGWAHAGLGYRGFGYRGLGYRPYGWGAAAAGALIGGALVGGAYYGSSYGSYPYYGGGYSYDYCPPRVQYGYGYSPVYYYGW
jgi:hypothetical protein